MKDDGRVKRVGFAEESLRKAYDSLKAGRFEDRQTYEYLGKAFDELEKNPYAGIKVPGSVWPKIYIKKYGIDNLRKYDMPNGWRLIYTLRGDTIQIVAVILEWFTTHKEYEKRFGYKVR